MGRGFFITGRQHSDFSISDSLTFAKGDRILAINPFILQNIWNDFCVSVLNLPHSLFSKEGKYR
jgi:hypothetical protein